MGFTPVTSKGAELEEAKKKLEEELAELHKKNDELSSQLSEMDKKVKSQITEASNLLADVQSSKDSEVPPKEMIANLRNQLITLIQGQTETSGELEKAQIINQELFKQANEAAVKREELALQKLKNEKEELKNARDDIEVELEETREANSELELTKAQLEQRVFNLENNLETSKEDLKQIGFLKSLQAAMAKRIESLRRIWIFQGTSRES